MSRSGEAFSLLTWRDEHAEIERHVVGAENALTSGSIDAAGSAIDALADALEDHMSVEERAYLPMVRRLSPRGEDFITAAETAHARLRESVEQLREFVELARWPEARRAFALLAERFRAHEAEEHAFAEEVMRVDPDAGRRTFGET
jgi:iron-sulfur cluster repair protein YtfE (RIC family)